MFAVTAARMREIEEESIKSGISVETLVQAAGEQVAECALEILGEQRKRRRILVLVGSGTNGSDGLIAARLLAKQGAEVRIVCPHGRPDNDRLLKDSKKAGCIILDSSDAIDKIKQVKDLWRPNIVIDAILGTGRSRPITGQTAMILNTVSEILPKRDSLTNPMVIAVDVPSGLNVDTGEVDPATLPADITVPAGHVKQGCLTTTGAEHCGTIRIGQIARVSQGLTDISWRLTEKTDNGKSRGLGLHILDCEDVMKMLPTRRATGHKGTFGHAVVVGGSESYRGAPALAARAALRAGAGTVAIAAPASITSSIAPMAPEATHIRLAHSGLDSESISWPSIRRPPASLSQAFERLQRQIAQYTSQFGGESRAPDADALLLGPGMGQSVQAKAEVERFFRGRWGESPAVLDADALNNLDGIPLWWQQLKGPTIITPHPGEMARLCYMSTQDVQARRLVLADESAKEWGVTVVLKGAYTVVASPDEPPSICPLAMPALASGGTGDALAGIITGFLSQGLTTSAAARAGVYVHGTAAALAAQANGNMTSGLLASDLIEKIPAAMDVIRRGEGPVRPLFA